MVKFRKIARFFSQNFEIKEINLDKNKGIRKLMKDYRINPKQENQIACVTRTYSM